MKSLCKFTKMALIISAVMVASGCAVYPSHTDAGYGPPPHAAAHGYRHKYQGHDVIYDSNLGVYIVVGRPNYYFYDNYYLKREHDRWYYSRELDRGWRDYKDYKLPRGLVNKYKHRKDDRDDRDHYRDDRYYR